MASQTHPQEPSALPAEKLPIGSINEEQPTAAPPLEEQEPSGEYMKYIVELRDYMKFVYEEEVRRTERLNAATRTYLLFIGSTLGTTLAGLKWLEIKPVGALSGSTGTFQTLLAVILLVSLIALALSFLFTIAVIKAWPTQKLCEPQEFVLESIPCYRTLLQSMVANYSISAERNGKINQKKFFFLSLASRAYRVGLSLLTISGVMYALR